MNMPRFSSNQPYVFHFKGVLSNGKPIPEEAIHEFGEYIAAILSDWGGADDPPDPEFGFETQCSFRREEVDVYES